MWSLISKKKPNTKSKKRRFVCIPTGDESSSKDLLHAVSRNSFACSKAEVLRACEEFLTIQRERPHYKPTLAHKRCHTHTHRHTSTSCSPLRNSRYRAQVTPSMPSSAFRLLHAPPALGAPPLVLRLPYSAFLTPPSLLCLPHPAFRALTPVYSIHLTKRYTLRASGMVEGGNVRGVGEDLRACEEFPPCRLTSHVRRLFGIRALQWLSVGTPEGVIQIGPFILQNTDKDFPKILKNISMLAKVVHGVKIFALAKNFFPSQLTSHLRRFCRAE